jgi:AcrR family transcriptional regulator
MPRLRPATQEHLLERIEQAAQEQFIKRGYAATTTREIAQGVGLTAGALYAHYPSKEALFTAVVKRYQRQLMGERSDNALLRCLRSSEFPFDIPQLAKAIRDLIRQNRGYWLLWYIDVVEFDGKHFRSQVAPKALIGAPELKARFETLRTAGTLRVEPELAFVMVYMHLFNYYCLETLFGGNNHYGVPEEKAIKTIVDVFMNGMLKKPR